MHRGDNEIEKDNENDATNDNQNVFNLTLESIHKPARSTIVITGTKASLSGRAGLKGRGARSNFYWRAPMT